jgi:hypothetical protein
MLAASFSWKEGGIISPPKPLLEASSVVTKEK